MQHTRRTYYFLWQLYHLQQDESNALQQQQLLTEELADLTARNESFEADLGGKRQQHAALLRQRMDVEKEQKKLQKRQEKKVWTLEYRAEQMFTIDAIMFGAAVARPAYAIMF